MLWQRIIIAAGQDRGRQRALNLTDNIANACAMIKGRAHEFYLNCEMRRRAALEAVSDVILCPGWVDTLHQPGDGGTRPDRFGRLVLERPIWVKANMFLEIFAGEGVMTASARLHPYYGDRVGEPWDIIYDKGP